MDIQKFPSIGKFRADFSMVWKKCRPLFQGLEKRVRGDGETGVHAVRIEPRRRAAGKLGMAGMRLLVAR